ncbi:MAG: nitroreductase/quinone reductase family protein [Pseudolysinimonas sp.]
MPSRTTFRVMNRAHRLALAVTRGRFGWRGNGMPMLELTTTGRKSGEKRTTMLSSPVQRGAEIIIVASRGGDPVHPAWYLNLTANPDVEVVFAGGERQAMRARTATPDERAELWTTITREHPNYAGYQRRTDREIPVVVLDPIGQATPKR